MINLARNYYKRKHSGVGSNPFPHHKPTQLPTYALHRKFKIGLPKQYAQHGVVAIRLSTHTNIPIPLFRLLTIPI